MKNTIKSTDKERLDAIANNAWHLVPVETGPDTYGWEIRESILGQPDKRISMCFSEDPRRVIDCAIYKASQARDQWHERDWEQEDE
jgi:hypothetical protein